MRPDGCVVPRGPTGEGEQETAQREERPSSSLAAAAASAVLSRPAARSTTPGQRRRFEVFLSPSGAGFAKGGCWSIRIPNLDLILDRAERAIHEGFAKPLLQPDSPSPLVEQLTPPESPGAADLTQAIRELEELEGTLGRPPRAIRELEVHEAPAQRAVLREVERGGPAGGRTPAPDDGNPSDEQLVTMAATTTAG